MLPSTFRPKSAADFVGPAQHHAIHLERLLGLAVPTGDPIAVLILGKPGIGKSQLAEHFVRLTGAGQWSTTKYNGTQLKIEQAEQLARDLHFRDMFGTYRVIRIEEVDMVPTVAQVRLLTILDDLPRHVAVIATSNCKIKNLEERFQRRFTVIELDAPTDEQIFTFITARWPQIRPADARNIATFCGGNLGAALKDCDAALLSATPLPMAA